MTTVLDFLANLYHSGLGYSAINTAKCAISSFLTKHSSPIGSHILVKRFMRGVFILRPSLPKYNVTWDVSKVLTYLEGISVNDNLVHLKELTMKTVMLLSLLTGQRLQSLQLIDLRNVELTDSMVKIRFGDLLKQSRPNYHLHEIMLQKYANKQLCIVYHLNLYCKVTKTLRGQGTSLFISFCKPHRAVSKDTIARWVKEVMRKSGIDISIFKPHSCRAASVSHAKKTGVQIGSILRTAGWSNDCTFRRFYNKPVSNDTSFAEAVLAKAHKDG